MLENNGNSSVKAVAWIGLVIAVIALVLAWSAYNRTGADLTERIEQEVEQAAEEVDDAAENVEEEAREETSDALEEGADELDDASDDAATDDDGAQN